MLTRKEFDFDTKKTNLSRYYNIINKFTCDDGIHKLIRFPGGLCKYISRTLNLQIDEIQEQENLYIGMQEKTLVGILVIILHKFTTIEPNITKII